MTMDEARAKYKAIRAWGMYMGSFDWYIDQEVSKAAAQNAPKDAIFRRVGADGKFAGWAVVDDIKSPDIKIAVEHYIARMR